MQIALSEAVLARIRFQVRALLPTDVHISSSRIAEALAAALGFGTNAALTAAIRDADRSQVPTAKIVPGGFAARLRQMGIPASENLDDIVFRAVRDARAAADGDCYEDLWQAAHDAYWDSSPGQHWTDLSNPQRFAYMSFLLTWRMSKSFVGIVDFLDTYSQREDVDICPHLAAAFALHADVDPDICAFLVEFMGQAALGANGDKGSIRQAQLRWGDHIFWAFQPRIHAFRDAVCRRWDQSVDPLSLEVSWPTVHRGACPRRWRSPRYPIAVGMTDRKTNCPLDLHDTGWNRTSEVVAVGLTCFAMWKHGVPYETMNEFVRATQGTGKGLPEVIAQWVDLDGNGGSSASLHGLRKILFPDHPLYHLLEMDRLGLDDVNLVLVRDSEDADLVETALRSGGWENIVSLGNLPPRSLSDPAYHVVSGLPETEHVPNAVELENRRVRWDTAMAALMRCDSDALRIDGNGQSIRWHLSLLKKAMMTGQFMILSGLDEMDRRAVLELADELRGGSTGYPRLIDATEQTLAHSRKAMP